MSRRLAIAVALLLGAAAPPLFAIQMGLNTQVRQFDTHKNFDERPFAKDDYGYGLAFEIRDVKGGWQLGALYTPDAGGKDEKEEYDYAVTPFLNLYVKDRVFIAGAGINQTYLPETDTEGDDWTDLYYDFMLGLDFPIGKRVSVSALAIYDFEGLNELGDFKFDDVEFAAALTLLF